MASHHSHAAEIVGTLLATGIAWMGKSAALHDLHTIGLSLMCAAGGWLLTKWLESNYGHRFKKKDDGKPT
jgi:hypothetical protein